MPLFRYKAYNEGGREVSGELEALSLKDAIKALRGEGLHPKELSSLKEQARRSFTRTRVSNEELALLSSQLSTLLESGVTLIDALGILSNETEHYALSQKLVELKDAITEGSTFSKALDSHADIFPKIYCTMVESGEESGTLGAVLERLSGYLEAKARLAEQVKTAMLYPALMTVVGVGVLSFLFVFVIPKITRIFEDSGNSLPFITVVLLWVVDLFVGYWPLIVAIVVGTTWWGYSFIKRPTSRQRRDTLLLSLPWLGPLSTKYYAATAARTLGSLLRSGVPMLRALDMSRRSVGNYVFEQAFEKAAGEVTEGSPLSKSLAKENAVPGLLTQMISVGEKGGNVDEMLLKAAASYEKEFERSVDRPLGLLEPALIIVMGVIVGFIVLAILLPIFDLNQVVR